jgi:hypothetical protein
LPSEGYKAIRCPVCGAPYKKVVQSDVSQLSCDYCGATFEVPLAESRAFPRCENHPEKYAAGKCNDCGGEFCSQCLHSYEFNTRQGSAELFLCPDCLKKRQSSQINSIIMGGIVFALVGFFMLVVFWPMGIIFLLLGGISIVYGFTRKPEEGPTSAEEHEGGALETTGTGEPSESEWEEADRLYSDLLEKYAQHWGLSSGANLLEDEIKAYTWDGYTWPEAVRKVYARQQKKIK